MQSYDRAAKSFAQSRKNMRWPEIEYFFQFLPKRGNILDIGCGSGRLLSHYYEYFWEFPTEYIWLDSSAWLLREAKNTYPYKRWILWDMTDIPFLWEGFVWDIFMVASFHHLESMEERKQCLRGLEKFLWKWNIVYMTSWALIYPSLQKVYAKNEIVESENIYWSKDFSLKLGNSQRYYHGFSLGELEYLVWESGYTLKENRLFDGEKNIITVFSKC